MKETNIDQLKERIFENLDIIKIYLKPKDGEADFSKPFVIKKGGTILDVAKGLFEGREGPEMAYVTGKSAKFGNQKVGESHLLQDGDIVTLVYDKF